MAKGIIVGLTVIKSDVMDFVREHDSMLSSIPVTGNCNYPPLTLPSYRRNDLFLTLHSCDVSLDSSIKRAPQNLELSFVVRTESGKTVKNCLYVGTGEQSFSDYRSIVYLHTNSPRWEETVRIDLQQLSAPLTHLYVEVRHIGSKDATLSGRVVCTSFLVLVKEDGTVVSDGAHSLSTYKLPRNQEAIQDPTYYLKGIESGVKLLVRKGDEIRFTSKLVSTEVTQSPALNGLWGWRSANSDEIIVNLIDKATFMDSREMFNYTKLLLDTVLDIIVEAGTARVAKKAYACLVMVLANLVDQRFGDNRLILESYLRDCFSFDNVHRPLLVCLRKSLTDRKQMTKRSNVVLNSLKTLQYLMRMIIKSRIAEEHRRARPTPPPKPSSNSASQASDENSSPQSPQNGDGGKSVEGASADGRAGGVRKKHEDIYLSDVQFKVMLMQMFAAFNSLMMNTSPGLIGAQNMALKNFTTWFDNLQSIFQRKDLSAIACKFVDAVHYDEKKKQRNVEKLHVIYTLVHGDIYQDGPSRVILMPTIFKQLQLHLMSENGEEQRMCTSILSTMLDRIETMVQDKDGTVWDVLGILPAIVNATISASQPDVQADMAVCMLSVLYLASRNDLATYFHRVSRSALRRYDFVLRFMQALRALIAGNVRPFPEKWYTLHICQFATLKKVVTVLIATFPRIILRLVPSSSASDIETLWELFFGIVFSFVTHPYLRLQTLTQARHAAILESYGDMRIVVMQQITQLCLDTNMRSQILLPCLRYVVRPLLQVLLLQQEELQDIAMQLYFLLMKEDYDQNDSFRRVETCTIDALDGIANTVAVRKFEEFTAKFSKQLGAHIRREPSLYTKGMEYLEDMGDLLELMLEFRTIPRRIEYEDDLTTATIRLMSYLQNTERKESYTKFIEILAQVHVQSGNFVEAGNATVMHAESLDWGEDLVPPSIGAPEKPLEGGALTLGSKAGGDGREATTSLPIQTSTQRKIALYNRAIEYFDRGKMWERALPVLSTLRAQFEHHLFDYTAVGRVLEKEAQFYRHMGSTQRLFPEYFRVGYYGKGFGKHLQNHEYIHCGQLLERMDTFRSRMLKRFPQAELLSYTTTPPEGTACHSCHILLFLCLICYLSERTLWSHSSLSSAPLLIVLSLFVLFRYQIITPAIFANHECEAGS